MAATRAALPILRDGFGQAQSTEKEPLDFATPADLAIEELLIERLKASFPGYGILAEEGGREGQTDSFWVIDPICGTTNFAIGLPFFNVNVALVENDLVTVGVLMDGMSGDIYWAERAGGAYLGGTPLQASDRSQAVHVDFGHNTATGQVGRMESVLRRILEEHVFHVRVLSSSVVLAYLAAGRLAGHVVEAVHPWDIAAGALLAEEAGAVVTDLSGNPWHWDGGELVCGASSDVHRALLSLVADAG
ncbi:MAG: inositol monophosphatase [Chloroflexi bacterium]|nr:inositol monophosphatase [Chloroflexota bacterium]